MAESYITRKGGSSGNATASDILSGKTATVSSGDITGTMPNNGTINITPSTSNQAIAQGYHSGSGVVYGDADLVAGNIKKNVNIFGVAGSYNNFNTVSGVTGSVNSGSFTDTDGFTWNFYRFTGNGTITFSGNGYADVLVVGGGGGGRAVSNLVGGGGGGGVRYGVCYFPSGTHNVIVGAGGYGEPSYADGESGTGGVSYFSSGRGFAVGGGRGAILYNNGTNLNTNGHGGGGSSGGTREYNGGTSYGGGAGGTVYNQNYSGITLNYNGVAVEYGSAMTTNGAGAVNTGQGGLGLGGTGGSGIIIVKVRTN